jgi:hypothetical protein
MSIMNRTMQLGRLAELREKARSLANELDAFVKSLLLHFEPLDKDMQYLQKIDPRYVKDLASSIEKAHKKYVLFIAEIKRLEDETGESNNAV